MSEKEITNVHHSQNVQVTYTDCLGRAVNPSVLIFPEKLPSDYDGMKAVFKLTINKNSALENIELLSGNRVFADYVKPALASSKFDVQYTPCWIVKYEHKE